MGHGLLLMEKATLGSQRLRVCFMASDVMRFLALLEAVEMGCSPFGASSIEQ